VIVIIDNAWHVILNYQCFSKTTLFFIIICPYMIKGEGKVCYKKKQPGYEKPRETGVVSKRSLR
jgi:hypothetical protein